jgi:hypothetical protein
VICDRNICFQNSKVGVALHVVSCHRATFIFSWLGGIREKKLNLQICLFLFVSFYVCLSVCLSLSLCLFVCLCGGNDFAEEVFAGMKGRHCRAKSSPSAFYEIRKFMYLQGFKVVQL